MVSPQVGLLAFGSECVRLDSAKLSDGTVRILVRGCGGGDSGAAAAEGWASLKAPIFTLIGVVTDTEQPPEAEASAEAEADAAAEWPLPVPWFDAIDVSAQMEAEECFKAALNLEEPPTSGETADDLAESISLLLHSTNGFDVHNKERRERYFKVGARVMPAAATLVGTDPPPCCLLPPPPRLYFQ